MGATRRWRLDGGAVNGNGDRQERTTFRICSCEKLSCKVWTDLEGLEVRCDDKYTTVFSRTRPSSALSRSITSFEDPTKAPEALNIGSTWRRRG